MISLLLIPLAVLFQDPQGLPVATGPADSDVADAVALPPFEYPERALHRGIEGHVVLNCAVAASGRMQDCAVVSEEPVGSGFGLVALRGARLARVSPEIAAERPHGTRVSFTVRFVLPEIDPEAPAEASPGTADGTRP